MCIRDRRVPVPLRAHVGLVRNGPALKVLGQQPVRTTNRGIVMVVWAHDANAGVHSELVADRTVDDRDRCERRGAAGTGGHATGCKSEDDGEVLGPCCLLYTHLTLPT